MIITETKLDSNFSCEQFVSGYSKPYRFDKNGSGRGIIISLLLKQGTISNKK